MSQTTNYFDKIIAVQLKKLPYKVIVQIYYILKICLKLSYFPSAWKVVKIIIIPVPKPGKPATAITSYRSISLLSILSKILEKIIYAHRNKQLQYNPPTIQL